MSDGRTCPKCGKLALVVGRRQYRCTVCRHTFTGTGRNKCHACRTQVDGIWFHSAREALRYVDLKHQEKLGIIAELELQVPYGLVVYGRKVGTYKADFVYMKDGAKIVEDVKGHRTQVYKIKRKLMLACHGIEVLET